MRTIKAKRMTLENFAAYGFFADMVNPRSVKIGERPVEFYRDMVQANLGNPVVSFSVVRAEKRPMIIDEAEQHFYTAEVLLPLDDDVVIFAAPSTNRTVPYNEFEAFIVPQNTLAVLKAGVWHKAQFPINKGLCHTLIALPERTYANDTLVAAFPEEERIRIEMVSTPT